MSQRTATILYGDELRNGDLKWVQDSMIADRTGLARHLQVYDIRLQVAVLRHRTAAQGQLYDLMTRPTFDAQGNLMPGDSIVVAADGLGDVVLDRHVKGHGHPNHAMTAWQVNDTAVQIFGGDKYAAYKEVHGHLPEAIPTFLLTELTEVLAVIADGPFFVKPVRGSLGAGQKSFASAHELRVWASQQSPELLKRHIFQPKYDFSQPIPGLRPYSNADTEQYEAYNTSKYPKEVRIYTTYNAQTGALDFTAVPRHSLPSKVADRIHAQWFFVDQAPLLARLSQSAGETAKRLAKVAGAQAVYISVDFGYGGRGNEAPDWHLIESNSRFTSLIDESLHPAVGAQVRRQFAKHVNGVLALEKVAHSHLFV